MRVVQLLRDEAAGLRRDYEPFGKDPVSVAKKREYDRLLRDAGDVDALRRRMETAHPDMKLVIPVVLKPPVVDARLGEE